MEIKILQQGEARRRSIAISYATDEERRLAAKDNLAPYKLFQNKVLYRQYVSNLPTSFCKQHKSSVGKGNPFEQARPIVP
jgi:hypothetical protein